MFSEMRILTLHTRPIPPICHAPFLPYVTPHFSHMSRPISPICHAPFLPYISPNTYVRRHLLFRQERRVGGRPSDARCRAALSFGGLIECDQVPFSLTHAPFFPICHTSHSSHISPRFVFFCVFLSPGPFFPDGTHPFFSISHRDLFV